MISFVCGITVGYALCRVAIMYRDYKASKMIVDLVKQMKAEQQRRQIDALMGRDEQ